MAEFKFYELLEELDALLSGPLDDGRVNRFSDLVKDPVLNTYAFDRLADAKWIRPLLEKSFFMNPPEPIRDKSASTISFPIWPESRYLARMAPVAAQQVLEIALAIPTTENVRVHEDIVDAALAMPVELAVKIVPRAQQWTKTPYSLLLPGKLGELVSHLALGGLKIEALDLARTILSIGLEEQQTKAGYAAWDYGQILENHILPDLMQVAGRETLTLLCDLLQTAISTSREAEDEKKPEDYSYIWRPAIEDHEQNHASYDLKGMLVSSVRQAADSLIENDEVNILSAIEGRPYKIFRRIGLYLRRKWPNTDAEGTESLMADPAMIDDAYLQHEVYQLLKERFGAFSAKTQDAYLFSVEKGIEPKPWPDYIEQQRGRKATLEEDARFVRYWQYEKLWPIQEYLAAKWRERFDALKQEFGKLDHPDFASYSTSWTGPTSPKGTSELRTMSIGELISYLKMWESSKDASAPSAEGLGRELTALVASEPVRFSQVANQIPGLDATYVRSFLEGLANAAKQKVVFTWHPVVELCRWALNQTQQAAEVKAGFVDRDPDWNWTRKTVAGLLDAGFAEWEGQLPFDLRHIVWEILKPLTNDQDITPERDENVYTRHSFDPATRSINITRGVAMHAVVKYALWVRRHIEKAEDGQERIKRGFDEMPEVREVFEYHLDPANEPTWAIRSVYGQWFPWLILLDTPWASQNVLRIFPQEEKYRELRDVAWETYIVFCAPYDAAFDLLRKEYERAVDQINIISDERKYLADPAERLADHIMSFYWRGKIDLKEQPNLVESLYQKASGKIRRHTLAFVGRSLGGSIGTIAPEIIERLKALWEKRLNVVRVDAIAASREELIDFGWWFASETFDDSWSISQLKDVLKLTGVVEPDHMVMKRLVEIANKMPVDAVECLGMMVEGDKEGWRIHGWIEEARTLLVTAQKSQDEKAKQAAIDLIHRMGARGYLQFRDLLSSARK